MPGRRGRSSGSDQETAGILCESCHGNHLIEPPVDAMLGSSDDAVCTSCHAVDDGTRGLAVADSMHTSLTSLVLARAETADLLDGALTRGMMTTDEELRLKSVDQALIKARTLVHSFEAGEVTALVSEGLATADTVRSNSAELIDEYYFRRKGFAFATIFITILAIGLYLKIRRLD